MSLPLPSADLQSIVHRVGPLWSRLRGKRLLFTGSTGFIGRWMCESMRDWAFDSVCRGISPACEVTAWDRQQHGDIRTFPNVPSAFTPELRSDYILHLAGPPSCHADQAELSDVIFNGTQRVCDFAKQCGARLLFASSGAAARNDTNYAKSKRHGEDMVRDVDGVSARVFTTFGPGMNFDRGYAISSFIKQALAGDPIQVTGDPRTRRSFLYIEDAVVQLWTLLLSADPGMYDVGASESHSIHEAAMAVAERFDTDTFTMPIHLSSGFTGEPEAYLPGAPMGGEQVDIYEGVRRTIQWARGTGD